MAPRAVGTNAAAATPSSSRAAKIAAEATEAATSSTPSMPISGPPTTKSLRPSRSA